MIVNLEKFKKDRAEAKTIAQIKEFAAKYSIKLRGTDDDIYRLFHSGPQWEQMDPVTMRPWRLIDIDGRIVKDFRSHKAARDYQSKFQMTQCTIVENKW